MATVAIVAVVWAVAAFYASMRIGASSDVVRQWVVCKYVVANVNPYALSKSILTDRYGVGQRNQVKIHGIPRDIPARLQPAVMTEHGPPEATYPPPAIGLLAPLLGPLRDSNQVLHVWFVVNLIALCGVTIGLARFWPLAPSPITASDARIPILVFLILFTPVFATFEGGQFSLLAFATLLIAHVPSLGWMTRGAALGLALLKPSLALPFVFIPLARREWRVLGLAMAIQGAATIYVMYQTGASISLFLDWLRISRYFMAGMYTAHDWLSPMAVISPSIVPIGSLAILLACGAVLGATSRRSLRRQFAFACATSYFWTYHIDYDFIVLAPILLRDLGWSSPPHRRTLSLAGVAIFGLVCLALTDYVTGGDDRLTHILRWMGRFLFLGLFLREFRLYLVGPAVENEEDTTASVPVSA